jgi:hypothetical protein
MKGESILDDLRLHDVSLIKIGYQILPKYFYDFYAEKNQIESRKADSKDAKIHIRSKIVELLRSSGIESPYFRTLSM